jgi:protein-disulfide isomerase
VIRGGVALAAYYDHLQKTALAQAKYLPAGSSPATPPERLLDPDAVYQVPVDLAKDPWKGAREPLVTVVEWGNFECPYSKYSACILKEVLLAYPNDVRLVFKHNPLPFHRLAMPAAEAAMAAHAQKGNVGFFAMHDRLFPMDKCQRPMPSIREWIQSLPRQDPRLDAPSLALHARAIGLDVNRFKVALEKNTYLQYIKDSQALAMTLGARGTPSFFVNGKYVRGVRPLHQMKELIDAEIAKAKKVMRERRISRARLYQTIIANGATAPVYLPPAPAPAAPRP